MRRVFKRNRRYDAKMVVAVGNSMLEVVYAVGVAVDCYDVVKKKGIMQWFRSMYQGGMGERGE